MSRAILYSVGGLGLLILASIGLSIFGVLPDELRVVNRPFVAVDNKEDIGRAIALVAIGGLGNEGEAKFVDFYTASAISTDGFFLTSKRVIDLGLIRPVWVFVNDRRYEAKFVGGDSLADFGVIKIDGDVPVRFKIGGPENLDRLNVDVMAVGHKKDPDASPLGWSLSTAHGTVSRTYADKLGTEWIDHSAAFVDAGRGGPLIFNGQIVGVNVKREGQITRAVSILSYRDRIRAWMADWRSGKRNLAEPPS